MSTFPRKSKKKLSSRPEAEVPPLEIDSMDDEGRRNEGKISNNMFFLPKSDESLTSSSLHSDVNGSLTASLTVEGVPVKMVVDPMAAVSFISDETMRKHFKHLILKQSNLLIKLTGGRLIELKSCVTVRAEFRQDEGILSLHVAEGQCPSVMGRDWINVFKSNTGYLMKLSNEVHLFDSYDHLLKKYTNALRATGGLVLKDIKARLGIDKHARPIHQKPRPLPYTLHKKMEDELSRLESQGIISQVEGNEWASSVIPLVKSDGSVRIAVDFNSTLNQLITLDAMPLVNDIFAPLRGGKVFSSIDVSHLDMEVYKDDRKYLVINTIFGYYTFKRLPYGLKNLAVIWKKTMDQILTGIAGVVCYLDQILLGGQDETHHLKRLETICERLAKYGLKVHLDQAKLFQPSLKLVGFMLDEKGLRGSADQCEVLTKLPRPSHATQVKSLLSFIDYYSCYLPDLSFLTAPLTQLTDQEDPAEFKWNKKCDDSFKCLRNLLASAGLMTLYDPRKPILLACSSSGSTIAAILSHGTTTGSELERPVAFICRSLDSPQKNFTFLEKKALSITWAVQTLHSYLYGRSFTVLTDEKSLVGLLGTKKSLPCSSSTRLLHYATYLQAFDFDIYYNTTRLVPVEGLLQFPFKTDDTFKLDNPALFQLNQLEQLPVTPSELAKATANEPGLAASYQWLATGDPAFKANLLGEESEYSIQDGCIFRSFRVVIPKRFQRYILNTLHERHVGLVKMKAMAGSAVWWPSIDQDIAAMTKDCIGCDKQSRNPERIPLHPWEWAWKPWQRVHIEFTGPVGGSMLLVIVDDFSKWPEVVPMGVDITAHKIIEALKILWSRYGLPEILVSDNGPQLVTDEFQCFLRWNNVKHVRKAVHHSAGINNSSDKFIRNLKKSLNRPLPPMDLAELQMRLTAFLSQYRRTLHLYGCADGQTSAGPLRTNYELVAPRAVNATANVVKSVGDLLLMRKYQKKWRGQ